MVMPGDNTEFTVTLIKPAAIEKGTKFTIREGGRTVGAGQVTEILDQFIKGQFKKMYFFIEVHLFLPKFVFFNRLM